MLDKRVEIFFSVSLVGRLWDVSSFLFSLPKVNVP